MMVQSSFKNFNVGSSFTHLKPFLTYSLVHHKPESSRSPAPPAPPSLKPTYPLGHDHLTHQTITALKHAEKENLRTSSILHHGANKFTEHCDSAPKHDLHLTAAKYRKAANEHYDAAHHLSSKAKGLESASGQVSVTELQALHHHAKASTAKARSNGEIATNGISYLKGAELANHLHGYETNRGQHAIAQKYKKGSELHYNAAVLSIPELDATQSVHKP